jgi:hypothetical protein
MSFDLDVAAHDYFPRGLISLKHTIFLTYIHCRHICQVHSLAAMFVSAKTRFSNISPEINFAGTFFPMLGTIFLLPA